MKLDTFFVRDLTLSTIDGVAKYYELVEAQLQSVKEDERQKIRETIKNWGLSEDEAWSEWNIAMQEHSATYDMLLVNFLRYSSIVLIFLVVENKLREICEAAKEVKGISSEVPKPRQRVVEAYKRYLESEIKISNVDWGKIYDLNKIRNCIVHALGKVTGFQHQHHIEQLARKPIGLFVSGDNYQYSDNTEPLYLEDGMLVLMPEFCRQAIKDVHDFFERLCESIPLPRFLVKSPS